MPQKFKGTIRTVIPLHADDKGKLPKRIQLFPWGAYETMPYGKLVFDDNVFDQMKTNFDAKTRKGVPIDVDHDGGKAAAWIVDVEKEPGKGFYGSIDYTPYGETLLKNKEYKYMSPEWSFDYVDPQNSTRHGATLIAGSLTNRPLFKNMDALVASEDGKTPESLTADEGVVILISSSNKEENSMNLKDLLKKDPSELTAEEKEFIKQHASELSADEKAKYDFLTADEEDAGDEDESGNEDEDSDEEDESGDEDESDDEDDDEDSEEDEDDSNSADDKVVSMKASEVESMKAQLAKYKEKEAYTATEKKVSKFIANDKGGKLLPKMKADVTDFVVSLSASQRKAFFSLLKQMPELKLAGELGKDEGEPKTASEKVVALIEKYKADDKLSEEKAQEKVQTEHPDLWKEYRK